MPTLYLVLESIWLRGLTEEFSDPEAINNLADDRQRGRPVRAFVDRAKAEAYCHTREEEARARINPFEFGLLLENLTSLDPGPFCDWLLDAGITPPEEVREETAFWDKWWQQHAQGLTPYQKARLWQALDRLRFYHIQAFPEWEQPAKG